MADSIPSDMWGSLLRIEGNTARSEAKIDSVDAKLGIVVRDVDTLKTEHADLRARVDRIDAERSIMVPEYQGVKDKVSGLEKWRDTTVAVQRQNARLATIAFSLFGTQAVAFIGYLIHLYMAS